MAIAWGAWERNCRLGIEVTASAGGATSTVTVSIYFESTVNVVDSVNVLNWAGSASGSKSPGMNVSGTGVRLIHQIVYVVSRVYGEAVAQAVAAWITGVDYVPDGRLDSGLGSASVAALPYLTPLPAPACTVTRVSDAQHTIGWTTDYTGSDGPRPWWQVRVERWDNVSNVWAGLANVVWSSTSYADTTTIADRGYRYRVRSINSAGESAPTYATPTNVYTTPAAHTGVEWTKDGADVVVSWTKASSLPVTTEVEEQVDGGAWVLVATVAAGISQWRDAAADPLVTHRYRVRPVVGGRAGVWTMTGIVELAAPPWSPLLVGPVSVTVDSVADPVVCSWQHRPTDGSSQVAYQLRWRLVGDLSWTTLAGTTQQSRSFPAGTWAHGLALEWQARTRGQHEDFGPWAPVVEFATGAKPVATLSNPVGGGYGTSRLQVSWAYADADGTAQAGAQVELWRAGGRVWSQTINGAVKTASITGLEDGATYSVRVRVLDGSGLWSTWASATIDVHFVPPPTPDATITWDDTLGAAVVQIANDNSDLPTLIDFLIPDPAHPGLYLMGGAPLTEDPDFPGLYLVGGGVALEPGVGAEHNTVERSVDGGVTWQLVADGVPLNGAVLDRTARSHGETLYRIIAVSATPTTATSPPISLVADSCWIWLSGGPGLDVVARCKGDVNIAATRSRPRKLVQFVGDSGPTEFASPRARVRRWKVDGQVAAHVDDTRRVDVWDTWPAWETIADLPAPLLLRDPLGRRAWVSIGDVDIQHTAGRKFAGVGTTLTEVQHVE